MREQQGLGADFPQRSSLVSTTNGTSTHGAFVQTRRVGTLSRQQMEIDEEMVDEEEEDDDDIWPDRMPTSARRYQSLPAEQPVVIRQGNRQYVLHAGPPPKQRASRPSQEQCRHDVEAYEAEAPSRPRRHWLLIFGVGMLAMLALWAGGNMLLGW